MQPIEISDYDRWCARERAVYVFKEFRQVLRKDLHKFLGHEDSASIDEFVQFFNRNNVERGHKLLDTKGVKYGAYFEALPDVCRVSEDYTKLYRAYEEPRPQGTRRIPDVPPRGANEDYRRQRTRRTPDFRPRKTFSSQSRQPSGDSQRPQSPPHSKSQSPPTLREVRSVSLSPTPAPRSHGGLTINQLLQVLVEFTHGLSGKTIPWDEYCRLLKEYDASAYEQFQKMKASGTERMDFIEREVSGSKNRIEVTGPDPLFMVMISDSILPHATNRTEPDPGPISEDEFEQSISRFPKVDLPFNKWLEVEVVDVDPMAFNLVVTFVCKNPDFERLQEELRAANMNNTLTVNEIYVGMPCAVPFEGTKDYHRAVVKDISDPLLPIVYYIDIGKQQNVAKGCIRSLDKQFRNRQLYCSDGELRDSPLYEERVRMGHKLMKKKTILIKAEKYDKVECRYIITLDAYSGIASDASRD